MMFPKKSCLRPYILSLLFACCFLISRAVSAQEMMPVQNYPQNAQKQPSANIIDEKALNDIRAFVNKDIVILSIKDQNIRYDSIGQEKIIELDNQWRAENKSDQKPLISATLSNPLSSYLTRVQAVSKGLYTEIFVMDKNGLNVGQSNISSDYWQGDEAKFQKTYPMGPAAIFIDEAEQDDDIGIWKTQVNMSVVDSSGEAIGAITVEVNLTELQRRQNFIKSH